MIAALIKSVKQLGDPKSRQILLLSLALAVAVFIALGWLVTLALAALPEFDSPLLAGLVGFMVRLGFVMISWLFFPVAVSLFVGVFVDSIVEATERLHYPERPRGAAPPMAQTVWAALKYGATVVAANLAVLPLYLLLIWVPLAPALLYYGLNAFLLSREFFELVAHRHMSWREARALRKANQTRILMAGLIIAVMFTMPLVNLVAPIIATALMVHLFIGLEVRRQKPVYRSMRECLEQNEHP